MNRIASFYHRRLALVDLAAGTARTAPLEYETLEQGLGGGALAAALTARHPGAMIFSTGPLVGGYAPASGLMTLSFPRSEGGGLIHAVMPLGHGAWLRQSGFDALVVTGNGASPQVIRCAKGTCSLENAPEARSGRAALRAALLRRTEDGRAALILADGATHAGQPLPVTAGAEYGSLPSGSLAGPALRMRNILALSLEGGKALPPGQLPLDNALRRASSGHVQSNPLANFFREAERDAALAAGFSLKSAACFHCPSPCLAWIETSRDAHLLLADHGAFAAALDACGKNAPACLAACDVAGVDPRLAAPFLKNAAAEEFSSILATLAWNGDNSGLQRPENGMSEAERAATILGVCPRLVRRIPSLSKEAFEAALDPGMAAMLARSAYLLGQEVFL